MENMKNTSPKFRLMLEITGSLGIIASLIFVGIQLQLDRNVALGSQYSVRAESYSANLRSYLESDYAMNTLSKQWENGFRPEWWDESDPAIPVNATHLDVQAIFLRLQLLMINMDNILYQYEIGLLEEDDFLLRRETWISLMQDSPAWKAFLTGPSNFTRARFFLQELASDLENEISANGT